MKNKYFILFILLCLAGIFLRLNTLDIPLYDDAGLMAASLKYHDSYYMNFVNSPHGPMNLIFFIIGAKLFGISTVGLRFTLFLISMIYLVILYLFTEKVLDKETACYAVLFNLFTFFALFNYFIMEPDGVIFSLLSLIIFFSLYMFIESKYKSKPGLIVSILCFAFLVSIKHRTGLLILPLFLYIWYAGKKLSKSIFYSSIYIFCSTTILIGYVLLSYLLYGTETTSYFLTLIFSHNTTHFEILQKILSPSIFITTLVAMSPLLLFMPLLTLRNLKEKYFIFYCWLSFVPLYLILIPYDYPYVKYLTGFMLPPITILSAASLVNEKIKKSTLGLIVLCTIFTSVAFVYINNIIPTDYWFFLEAFGPIVKVWQPFIYLVFGIGLLLFIFVLLWKHSSLRTFATAFFLILTFSFNIMMIADNVVDKTHKNLINDARRYYMDHDGEVGTIYAWNEDIAFYLGNVGFYVQLEEDPYLGNKRYNSTVLREYSRSTGMGQQGYIDLDNPLDTIENYTAEMGGTVFLLNYPYKYIVAASSDAQEKIDFFDANCLKEQETVYKTGSLVIYRC